MSKHATYYGGVANDLGNVRRLPQTSFDAFVKEILGHPVPLNVSRAVFQAMDKAKRDRVKRTAYFTPAAYDSNPSPRNYAHATHVFLVALDIDDSGHAAPFVRDPDAVAEALEPWPVAMYHTASSTKEAPRLRIVVAADAIPRDSYHRAVAAVAHRLGLPAVTSESKVSVQAMYYPVQFADDPDDEHPLLLGEVDGKPLGVHDLSPGAADKPSSPRNPASTPTEGQNSFDDLEFLRPQSDDIALEDAKEALEHLDPDCDRREWLEVAAALKHQFPRGDDLEGAFTIFDEWSAKGSKYAGIKDTTAMWESLRPNPRGRAPITIRTVLHRAAAAGWSSAKTAAKCFTATMLWISDKARTDSELLAQGVKRIAATPLLSPLERGTLLSRLQDVLKAKGHKVSRSDMQKELRHLEQLAARATGTSTDATAKSPAEKLLPAWARGICYVAKANEFFQRSTGREYKPEVLDNVYNFLLMPPSAQGNPMEAETSGRPIMRAQDFLLNVARIPRVDYYHYDPSHPEESIISDGKKRYVNTYLPTYPEPDPARAEDAGDLFTEHLERLIGEPSYRNTLLDFLTYQVQCPGQKIRWAALLQGAEGCGKTFLSDAMRSVLGKRNVTSVDASLLLTSGFNGWATGSQLVCMEEVRVVGHNRHEVMNRLKPCITNDTISINKKYVDLAELPNNSNYLMYTNYHDSLAVTQGDRRYFVVCSAMQTKEQVEALPDGYFNDLYDMVKTNGAGLRAWFEGRSIGADFRPDGHAPRTSYLAALTQIAASPLASAVTTALQDGDHPLVKIDMVSITHLRRVMEQMAGLGNFSDQALVSILKEMGYHSHGRIRLDEQRTSIWTKSESWRRADPAQVTLEARNRFANLPDNTLGFDLL